MELAALRMETADLALTVPRAERRRSHMDLIVGLWAAELLGRRGLDADAYARSVVYAGVTSKSGLGGFEKVVADLAPLGVAENAIRNRYAGAGLPLRAPDRTGSPPEA